MLLYICQTPPYFQFTKKLNNWNSEKVYLVVSGYLLVFLGRLLVVCSHLVVVRDSLLELCGRLLVVCGHLLVVCGRLRVVSDRLYSFVVVCGGLRSLPVLVTTYFNRVFNP